LTGVCGDGLKNMVESDESDFKRSRLHARTTKKKPANVAPTL
jgi:hypothetical protein